MRYYYHYRYYIICTRGGMPLRGLLPIIIPNIIMQMRFGPDDRRSACQKTIRVSILWTEKSYFKIYCNYIMYTQKPCLFSRDHRFLWVFFVSVVYNTRVVNYQRRQRLYICAHPRTTILLTITKFAILIRGLFFYLNTAHDSGLTRFQFH